MIWTESFRGRSVLITGHTGFKGSWLSLWLHRLGAHVSGFAVDIPSSPNNFDASAIGDLLANDVRGDVRDANSLQEIIESLHPDVIFHLAAQTLVRASYAEPRQTFETNVLGTVNVLESVRVSRRPCVVIIVASDKCYENGEVRRRHGETDPLGGEDPYSASKAAAEIAAHAYRSSFFPPHDFRNHRVKVASVRAGNVIGGGDWANDRIVPDIVRALGASGHVALRNPESIRPWQHVLDALYGYLLLADRMLSSDEPALASAWNFGPDAHDEATVRRLVEAFLNAWGSGSWYSEGERLAPPEQKCLRLSNEKARTELGWKPRWNFTESVQHTARWYRQFFEKPDCSTRDLCLQDIEHYESGIANDGSHESIFQHSVER